MGDAEFYHLGEIVLEHLEKAAYPPQLPPETQEVLLRYSKKSQGFRLLYQLYLELPLLVRYAYKPLNRWFNAVAELKQGDDDDKVLLEFQMIKVTCIYYIVRPILCVVINEKFHQPGHTLLFHGAKQASSVVDILNNGIKLNCGRTNLGFSSGSGFYLSDSFTAAKYWVRNNNHRPSAVIIYSVPNYLLQCGEAAGLDLTEHKNEWSRIVKYYRKEMIGGFDIVDLELNRSFYKGPVCRNGAMIRKGSDVQPSPLVINGREKNIP